MAAFMSGYRVLDMAWLGPGPFCSQMLGDLGFDVIRITEVARGAGRRGGRSLQTAFSFHEPPPRNVQAGMRNARNIAIDLKSEGGQAVFRRLLERADVVQEGFRPGVVNRLGVDYESVRKVKPDIVYAALTGYGQDGPYRDWVGHDLNYLSVSGFIAMNGRAGEEPAIPGALIADFAAGGMSAAIHILAALLRRERSGRGAYADVSMTDAVFQINSLPIGGYLSSGLEPRRGETFTSGFWPWYHVYRTADGKHVSVGAIEPWFYEALCRTLGREDLVGQQWSVERRAQTMAEFEQIFASRTRAEWEAAFEGVDACFAPVSSVAEAADDPQMLARQMVLSLPHPEHGSVRQVGSMVKLDGVQVEARSWDTGAGAHTDAVLAEHGFAAGEIAALRAQGAVG